VRELIEGTGCGVLLLLHHLRKYAVDSGSTFALSGAHRWAGKADAVAYLHFANRAGQDRVRFTVAKDRDGEKRVMEFLRQGRRFIPLQSEAVPTGDWGVVRAYLQEHGEATYRELLDALQEAGLRMTENALHKRLKRWESRGRLVIERRGFPPTAFVKLPVAQFRHLPPLRDSYGENGGNDNPSSNSAISSISAILDTTPTGEQNGSVVADTTEPASTPAYDPASESFAEWLERADQVLDALDPAHGQATNGEGFVARDWNEVEEWYKAVVSASPPALRAGGEQLSFALEDGTYGTWN
jgi:hypothetical protein